MVTCHLCYWKLPILIENEWLLFVAHCCLSERPLGTITAITSLQLLLLLPAVSIINICQFETHEQLHIWEVRAWHCHYHSCSTRKCACFCQRCNHHDASRIFGLWLCFTMTWLEPETISLQKQSPFWRRSHRKVSIMFRWCSKGAKRSERLWLPCDWLVNEVV